MLTGPRCTRRDLIGPFPNRTRSPSDVHHPYVGESLLEYTIAMVIVEEFFYQKCQA